MEWLGKSPVTIPDSVDSICKISKSSSDENRRSDSASRHFRRVQFNEIVPKEKYSNGYRSRFLGPADPISRDRVTEDAKPTDARTIHPQKQFPRLNAIAPKTSGDLEDQGVCK